MTKKIHEPLTKEQEADEIVRRLSAPPRTIGEIAEEMWLNTIAGELAKEIDEEIVRSLTGVPSESTRPKLTIIKENVNMKALLAGYGGIGKNVYYPELQKLGYEIDILDSMSSAATYADISDVKGKYDLGVICTPNYTHARIASALVNLRTTDIFVEKPGAGSADEWIDLCEHGQSRIHLIKNNLYRADYGNITKLMNEKRVIGVDINWLNNNRIPNPGNWFTNKSFAMSGVSGDLMPHLYCFAVHLFGEQVIVESKFEQSSYRRWDLKNIKSTDYGVIEPAGVYDVDDYATARTVVNDIPLRLTASWKEGYDKQSITLFFEDGTTYEWSFGLCPAEAYGTMLQDLTVSTRVDTAIHRFLEGFNK